MKQKSILCLLSLLSYFVFAQEATYKVGTSKVSIEPDNSVFSLTLGGYGAPRDGRFSITWVEQGKLPDIDYIAGIGNYLYGINGAGNIIRKDVTLHSSMWENAGEAGDIKLIVGLKGVLYGASLDGKIYRSSLKKIKWEQIGRLKGLLELCASENKLYAGTHDGKLLEGVLSKKIISWNNIGNFGNMKSIAARGERIYALSDNRILYKKNNDRTDTSWSKIGYKNGVTYNIDVERIAIAGGLLYAVSRDNRLYVAEHKSRKDLYANTIAINSDNKTAVLVGLDLTGFDYSFSQKIKREIARKRGIPAEAIIINASHTHFSPIVQAWPTWGEFARYPDSIYLNDIVIKNVVKGIEEALDNMKKSTIGFARTKSIIGGNRALSGADGLYDPTVDIINIESVDKKKHDLFFTAACHPVFRNEGEEGFTINANFPGIAKDIIEKKMNIVNATFFQGCSGDINPLDGDHIKTGTILAADVLDALNTGQETVSGPVSYALDSVLIPVKAWDRKKVEEFRAQNVGQEGNVEAEKNVRWADIMLRYFKDGNMPEYMPVYIQTINIGNWKLVGLSREAVTEYSLSIRKLWPDKLVSVAGFCNDISSYLPNAAHIKAQNYEGLNSFLWYGQPGVFPESILDIIVGRIKSNND